MANLADTSRANIVYVRETEWGKIPTEGEHKVKRLRITDEGLMVNRTTTVSDEIRGDRQIPDLIATNFQAEGDVNAEFSVDSFNDFIESALQSDRDFAGTLLAPLKTEVGVETITSIKFTQDAGKKKYGSLEFTFAGANTSAKQLNRSVMSELIAAGDVVSIGTNYYFLTAHFTIPEVSGSPSTDKLKVNARLLDEATSATFGTSTLSGTGLTSAGDVYIYKSIKNGIKPRSFSIEKRFGLDDGTINYLSFRGMIVSNLNLTVDAESKITMSMSFMGRDGETSTATKFNNAIGGNAPIETNTTITNAIDHIGTIEDGTGMQSLVKSINFDMANNLRGRTAIGTRGNLSIGTGRYNLTGSITHYFQNSAIYDRYLNNEAFSLYFILDTEFIDEDNVNGYIFYMPNVKFTESRVVASGIDTDIMVESSYQALRDPVTNATFIVTRVNSS